MIVPGWRWWVTPSGAAWDPTAPWWQKLLRIVYDVPLLAHPGGAWLIVAWEALGWWVTSGDLGGMAWWNVLLGEAVNQWHKWRDGDYGPDPGTIARNIIWRMVLSAGATLPAWWLW